MGIPNAAQLLALWEQGVDLPLPRKALLLLAAACPESSGDELAGLSLGRRDALLRELRERFFGSAIKLIAPCPACNETLETELCLGDLGLEAPAIGEQTLTIDGYQIAFRLLAAGDLLDLPDDPAEARLELLSRCVIAVRDVEGVNALPRTLPESVIAALGEKLSQADPGADLQFSLICPACALEWNSPFDITMALWKEVQAWAQRTLRDVHALARAYGWRERDILALSPTRRQIYLELNLQ